MRTADGPAGSDPIFAPGPAHAGGDRYLPWILVPAAAAGVVGSLGLSLALGLKACPLCFYQRSFALVALVALLLAQWNASAEGRAMGLRLAWTSCLAGLGVALFHVRLEARSVLECPDGVLGVGTAPQQSLAFFVLFAALLAPRVFARGWARGPAVLATVLGVLVAVASLVANPPLPPVPTKPYTEPPTICRPPFPA